MSMNRILAFSACLVIVLPSSTLAGGQDDSEISLAGASTIECRFSLVAVSTWTDGKPEVAVNPTDLELRFESVNTDEGTAQLGSGIGAYDIIVRYAEGYLHFVQSFRDGPLYSTTVIEKETTEGKFVAAHSRHEYTDYRLAGFTSSPEQYYGECEVLD